MSYNRRDFLGMAAGIAGSANVIVATGQADDQAGFISEWTRLIRPPMRIGFRRIFDPSTGEDKPWYINDHCFIQARDGMWHVFGITHPEPANPQDETFLVHAIAPDLMGPWTKRAPVMHADKALGETVIWAPHVIEHEGQYWMFYCAGGASHARFRIHMATSTDLQTWQRHPANPLLIDGFDARDPMVMRHGDQWILYYTANATPHGGNHIVAAVTSRDLVHWSDRQVVFRSLAVGTAGGPTESPFVVARNGRFYLFVCTNERYNTTAVYASGSPFSWHPADIVTTFPAHAAEAVSDSKDRWFVSSAGWGQGGLYLAEMNWDDPTA